MNAVIVIDLPYDSGRVSTIENINKCPMEIRYCGSLVATLQSGEKIVFDKPPSIVSLVS